VAGTDELTELRREECLRLLAGGVVGRVVFTEAALPAAHPVTYLLDGDEIVFRTAGGGKMHHIIAFQTDEIDPASRTGWSVLAVGQAYEVTDSQRLAGLADRMPAPWSTHRDGHTVAIPLQRLTGRRLFS
jgi:nitroimidazol reductase NimA-like FMN-containing flavoprotein (pyridoxamine 5'-phosphate oxidase superfamily)